MLPFFELLDTQEEKDQLSTLYQVFEKQLYHVAEVQLKDAVKAEDVLQETFVTMTEHLDKIDEEAYAVMSTYLKNYADKMTISEYSGSIGDIYCGKAWGYMATVLNSKITDLFRKENRDNIISLDEVEGMVPSTGNINPLEQLEQLEKVLLVKHILSQMKYPYKEAISMHYFDRLSAAEIGAVIGKSEENVRQILKRGRDKMRLQLSEVKYNDF